MLRNNSTKKLIRIRPEKMNFEQARLLGKYLDNENPDILAKAAELQLDEIDFKVTRNLIRDQTNKNFYYVISNDEKDIKGEGAHSKVRQIIGTITIIHTENGTPIAQFESNFDHVVQIKNPKFCQKRRQEEYNHNETINDYFHALNFHLGMQKPIKRTKIWLKKIKTSLSSHSSNPSKKPINNFKKSRTLKTFTIFTNKGIHEEGYAVMKNIKGIDFDENISLHFFEESSDNSRYLPFAKAVSLFLLLLKAYKEQVSDINRVHRDIKPSNLLIDLTTSPITINFIDPETLRKPYLIEKSFSGSAGFIAPEIYYVYLNLKNNEQHNIFITPARDMFSLGVLLIGFLNPNLHPYSILEAFTSREEAVVGFWEIVNSVESYHLYKYFMLNPDNNPDQFRDHDFFYFLGNSISDEHKAIMETLLINMTHKNPDQRPAIEQVIEVFEKFEKDLTSGNHVTMKK